MKGKTESDSGKMKMNNRQNKCKEVKFGLTQLPRTSRGKDHAEGDDTGKPKWRTCWHLGEYNHSKVFPDILGSLPGKAKEKTTWGLKFQS